MPELIGSLDCGTTSTRFFIFDQYANVITSHQKEFKQHYPKQGWMEEDPEEIYESCLECVNKAIEKLESETEYKRGDVKGFGITNQRETTLVWDKKTGKKLYNAIVWPDTRNTSTVKKLAKQSKDGLDALKEKTGLPISTYFAGVKLRWLLDNVKEVAEAHENKTLLFGTVDTYLLWKFTGGLDGGLLYTDVTNASRTMFMSLKTLDWDAELLEFFGVDKSCLAQIVSNSQVYGDMKCGSNLDGVPIAGLVGDQQGALVGNKCFQPGQAKNTYGTGCFMLLNTGEDIVASKNGLLTTVAFKPGKDAKAHYALEGSIAVAGSSVKWLRDQLGLIKEANDIGELAATVKDTGGVFFVTAFSGLFAPYWDDSATGTIVGLTGYTTKAHIARATLEATCFQTRAILDSMRKDSSTELKTMMVDGGMTNSDMCMQLQADILGADVIRPQMRESTALGSALLAGAALKLFGWDLEKPETLDKVNTAGAETFEPKVSDEERDKRYFHWERAVKRAMHWNEDVDPEADPEARKGEEAEQ